MVHHQPGQGWMSVPMATVTYTQDLSDSSPKQSTRCSSKQLQVPQKNSVFVYDQRLLNEQKI